MTSTSSHMSSCVLDEQNFRRCCRLLLQQSEQLNDGWSWEPVQDSEEGYLRKTTLRSVVINSSTVWDLEGSSSESEPYTSCHFRPDQLGHESEQSVPIALDETDTMEDDIDDDDEGDGVCAVTKGSSKVLQYEYHIMYSCSYSTPVLYFRASTLQGRSLSLEEVWSSVHPNFRLRLQNSPLNTISMQEHPLLGQPFFMLHPCRTEEFMRPVMLAAQEQHRPVNYVLSWLSVVGPVVGLDVTLKYSQLHPAASISSTESD
ncbi:ubiquitin-like-conjugating enzyme ATG10 isoform X1 [Acanthopagrus latus]|uniref:ubiquitin-like-conjugating enzyme ATG10 isoform X1 n=2 Tax=Acanthopagrus latus TaxID=8177 RepID=UPI00187C9A70|nr:ubiquitin-like-conjugating enzyme ATG10 isoform X1 [Acanthopagrus latus]